MGTSAVAARPGEGVLTAGSTTSAGFSEVYRTHSRHLYVAALRLLRRPEEAEDALQETFLTLYRKAPDLAGSRLGAWLHRVMVNECIDRMRRGRRWRTTGVDEDLAPAPPPQDGPNLDLQRAVSRLPERARLVFLLHDAELASSYGSVEARQIGGNLKVVASSGPSKISDVEGSLELKGSYADAVVERIAGLAEISISSGGVTADGIEGNLTITCSYGTVRASNVEGNLSVHASSTGVQAKQITGTVDVKTTYAGVTVVGAGGAVTVRNENGAINVKGLSGEALTARHDAETTYADIDFRWPEGRSLAFRLESSYGHLDCDFPGTLKERGSRYTLEGSTGEGGASVSLISKSGSVRLRGE